MKFPALPDEFMTASREQIIEIVHRYLEQAFSGRHGDQEDEMLRELPQPLADFWVLQWLDYEVLQGGLATYFMNSHGRQVLLAIDALRRCGADDAASCLSKANLIVSQHQTAWSTRANELDKQGEYAITRPFLDLEGIDELTPTAERFSDIWSDSKPHWSDLMQERLEHFQRRLRSSSTPP